MEQLDVDIVPYIVLLVVPVLGRMSDPSDSIRFMATQCFATLIRLLPLEVRQHPHGDGGGGGWVEDGVADLVCGLPGRYTGPSSHVC